jgi:3'-5' exonuclease
MKPLFLDIETIPCQDPVLRDEIAKPVLELYDQKAATITAEISALRPPANYKDPAKIEQWKAEELPKKKAALEADRAALVTECEAKVDEAWRKTSFDGAYCQIVVIGSAIEERNPLTLYEKDPKKVLSLGAEAKLLRSFYAALELVPESERQALTWVGHHIIGFDLRVIYQRSVIHGIRPPAWIPFNAKPWDGSVYDTMIAWAGVGGRIGQDKLCRILGIDAKGSELGDEIDGSRVWDFVKEGRIADVATYCGGDVHRARECYRRLTFAPIAPAASLQVVA